MKERKYHSDFARVTVMVNGLPLSMYAEVDVSIRKPTKLDAASRAAWDAIKSEQDTAITAEFIPVGAP